MIDEAPALTALANGHALCGDQYCNRKINRANVDILDLMHRPVINVRRHSLNSLTIIVDAGVPLRFLFIPDVVYKSQSVDVDSSGNAPHSRLAQA
jgi:hypothetical protein